MDRELSGLLSGSVRLTPVILCHGCQFLIGSRLDVLALDPLTLINFVGRKVIKMTLTRTISILLLFQLPLLFAFIVEHFLSIMRHQVTQHSS